MVCCKELVANTMLQVTRIENNMISLPIIRDARILKTSQRGAELWRIRYSTYAVDIWLKPSWNLCTPNETMDGHWGTDDEEVAEKIRYAIEHDQWNRKESAKFK